MMFPSWLARSLSPATVRIYIAAVRSLHIDLGFTDPTLNAPRLRRVIKGIQRSDVVSRPRRRPITHETLLAILSSLHSSGSSYDALMFWSACCLAFYGFLRVSEFTSSVPFNPSRDLTLADIQFLLSSSVAQLRIRIKRSKPTPSVKDVISTWQGPLARLVLLPRCLHTSPFVVHLQARFLSGQMALP
jgi:hypothetical protein